MVIRPLSRELQKKAESELNEDPDRLEEDLERIREWVQKETHLTIRTDDQWVIAFLRGCKFSLQRTKEKLDYFYTMRTLVPEFFASRDPLSSEIQEVLKVGAILPFPLTTDVAGPRIIHFRFSACHPEKISIVSFMKVFLMFMDVLMLEDDNSMVSGITVWADYTKFPLSYMLQYTPSFLQKSVLCVQSAYPLRIKGIYCTNTPSVFETIFKLVRSFMNEKLLKRFKVFSEANVDKFYNDIPQRFLTKQYGGEMDSLDELTSEWKQKMESYRDWFLEDTKYCSNESLRQGKPVTSADVFGVEGSFRKLVID